MCHTVECTFFFFFNYLTVQHVCHCAFMFISTPNIPNSVRNSSVNLFNVFNSAFYVSEISNTPRSVGSFPRIKIWKMMEVFFLFLQTRGHQTNCFFRNTRIFIAIFKCVNFFRERDDYLSQVKFLCIRSHHMSHLRNENLSLFETE